MKRCCQCTVAVPVFTMSLMDLSAYFLIFSTVLMALLWGGDETLGNFYGNVSVLGSSMIWLPSFQMGLLPQAVPCWSEDHIIIILLLLCYYCLIWPVKLPKWHVYVLFTGNVAQNVAQCFYLLSWVNYLTLKRTVEVAGFSKLVNALHVTNMFLFVLIFFFFNTCHLRHYYGVNLLSSP